jgi:glutathione S-transferase
MQPPFRLYGAEHSAFSQKLLTYLRYKGFDHTYIPRTADNAAEFTRLARLPLVPLLVEADGRTAQDTTQIMERLDAAHPTPPARPEDPALGFLACLIEDWADEWLNKVSLHFRWADEADRMAAAQASVAAIYPNGAPEGAAEVIAARMAAKLWRRLSRKRWRFWMPTSWPVRSCWAACPAWRTSPLPRSWPNSRKTPARRRFFARRRG